jgi:CIC family chloride channel protein
VKVHDFMVPLKEGEDDAFTPEGADKTAWLSPDATIEQALRTFDRLGHDRIPVIDAHDPERISGWASKDDALHYFNQALIDAHVEQHR